jgi:hypothetical protein
MSSDAPNQSQGDGEPPKPPDPLPAPPFIQEEVQYSQVSARVPERVGRGVFSTGVMVFQGPHEFILDFLLRMTQPHQVVARVILPPSMLPGLISALRENLANYSGKFGPPPALPSPLPGSKPPSVEDLYQQLKLPDDLLSGVYANTAMIAHSASEFCLDFITTFYPRSAVSCRVYLSAPQVPGLLNTLTHSHQEYQKKLAAAQQPKPPQESG